MVHDDYFVQIVDTNPHIVDLSSQDEGRKNQQTTQNYSNIRIHPVFTNITSSTRQFLQEDSLLTHSIRTLESILMVHPVDGNLRIPPRCTEYTYGVNQGKCRSPPLLSQSGYGCGEFGTIPLTYIGVREVCTSLWDSSSCSIQGPNGTGVSNADYLLFVSASFTSKLLYIQ